MNPILIALRQGGGTLTNEEMVDAVATIMHLPDDVMNRKQQVLDALLAMPPDAFERLSQRLSRECGFTQVEVIGRSGDGGIDGKGVLRLGGLINFQVVFQCKRYAGTVSSGTIRDFRGAMIGRADKGLIISTGTFSRDARAGGRAGRRTSH